MDLDYKDALKDSPEWIKMAWEEYQKMGAEYMSNHPFLWFVLGKGKGTMPFKSSKKDAKYVHPSPYKGAYCGNCIFYYVQPIRKTKVCSQMRGKVGYDAFCKLWEGINKK